MWRDDRQLALAQLTEGLLAAADGHAAAATRLEDAGLSRMLDDLARRRREAGERLGEQLPLLHDLPPAPDPDAETLQELLSRLRAALAGDARRCILDERLQTEQMLAERVAAARALDYPPPIPALLEALFRDVAQVVEQLQAALEGTPAA